MRVPFLPPVRRPRAAHRLVPALLASACAAAISLPAAAAAAAPPAVSAAPAASAEEAGVHWLDVRDEGDVDRDFALARQQGKPVLLYWGARWCPPCNQLKATLFNRQDFIERSRSVIAVHLDGDVPAAQKLGTRFKVVGYPTLILFSPTGSELTRLPGEADARQVLDALQLALASGRPAQAVLADARAGRPLPGAEWRVLAFYSWDTDESALVPAAQRAAVLAQLAAACPAAEREAGTRLMLKSLVEAQDEGHAAPATAAQRARVMALLADAAASREQMDVLTNWVPELVKSLAPARGAERTTVEAALDTALRRLQADATLSRADRMAALSARVDLARLDQGDTKHPVLPAALRREVREAAHRADVEITSAFERQAVITEAASTLAEAGDWAASDALLRANLSKSHSPYYLMSELARNARDEGRPSEALTWYQSAFEHSDGPATRLQWGASYLAALVALAPGDAARIEHLASTLIDEAGQQPAGFYERSGRSMRQVGAQLVKWNAGGHHAEVMNRLQSRLAAVCAKLPAGDAQAATCRGLFQPAAGGRA